jgi:predicted permease
MTGNLTGTPRPTLVDNSLTIFGDALAPSALFAIGLGLSFEDVRVNFRPSMLLVVSTHPTSAVLSDAWYLAKRVTLSLALRS